MLLLVLLLISVCTHFFFRYTKFTKDGTCLSIRVHAFPNFEFVTLSSQYLGVAGLYNSVKCVPMTTVKISEGILENPKEKHAYFQRERRE